MSYRIDAQLKRIMDERQVGVHGVVQRVAKIGGKITPRRLALLLRGFPATDDEINWLSLTMNVPAWELKEKLSPIQRENKERLGRLLDARGLQHLFPKFWTYVRQHVQYRSSDKPLDERHLLGLLKLFLDCPEEFGEEDVA